MKLSENGRLALLSIGTLVIGVTSNLVANSIYTKSKIGTDKKTLIVGSAVILGVAFGLMKLVKK